MAYKIVNANKRHDGSYGWRVRYISWKDGKPHARHVKASEWPAIGFRADMTREQAEALCRIINAQDKRDRVEKRRQAALARVADDAERLGAWLPPEVLRPFEEKVSDTFKIRPVAWRAAKKLIVDVDLPPWEWMWNTKHLTDYMLAKAFSPDYCNRIWRALKVYSNFYCYKTGKQLYEKLPDIPKSTLNKVQERYWQVRGDRFVTKRLTPEMLADYKTKLDPKHYNWLVIAHYFGLRPQEMARLTVAHSPRYWFVSEGDGRGYPWALHVYQKKLEGRGIPENHRWKAIPAGEPEQQALLDIIKSGAFKRPAPKTLVRRLGVAVKLRSPRRDFRPWLLSRGYSKETCSIWLGHLQPDTKMADEHYGGEHYVHWEAPTKKAA